MRPTPRPAKAVRRRISCGVLTQNPAAEEFFETLSAGEPVRRHLTVSTEAKRPETRARRIAQYVEMLAAGQTFH